MQYRRWLKAWARVKFVLVGSRGYWPKTTKFSEKPSPQNCCRDIDTKTTIFCSVLWQVTKAGFTILSLKRNGRVWNGTICILHQKRRRRQCHQLRRWWAQSSGMQRGWFWLNSWNMGKPSLLLVMSRHCTSSVVHCALNVQDETSSSCMTTLAPTPLASHRKHSKDGVGSSSTLLLHPWSGTLRLPSFRICEGSAAWTTLWDNGGNSESSASVSSDGWKGVLPQGNFQTSRTLGEMCTKKWWLCGKIKKVM